MNFPFFPENRIRNINKDFIAKDIYLRKRHFILMLYKTNKQKLLYGICIISMRFQNTKPMKHYLQSYLDTSWHLSYDVFIISFLSLASPASFRAHVRTHTHTHRLITWNSLMRVIAAGLLISVFLSLCLLSWLFSQDLNVPQKNKHASLLVHQLHVDHSCCRHLHGHCEAAIRHLLELNPITVKESLCMNTAVNVLEDSVLIDEVCWKHFLSPTTMICSLLVNAGVRLKT